MKTKYVYILMLGLLSVFSTGCEDRLDIANMEIWVVRKIL